MIDVELKTLEARWYQVFDQYQTLKQAAVQQVNRWEWATSERYQLRPLFYKRYPGRGRVLKTPPTNIERQPVEYGFDTQHRVTVQRQYHPLYPPIETFYAYSDAFVEMVTFSTVTGTPIPGQVERLYYEDKRVDRYGSFKLDGFGPGPNYRGDRVPQAILRLMSLAHGILRNHELYFYQGDHVVKIQVYAEGYGPQPSEYEERVTYDARGKVEQITAIWANAQRILYRSRKPGQTLLSIVDDARSKLIEAIPKVIAAARFKEPLYCIDLVYRGADFYFPPIINPGFESQRQIILRDHRSDGLFVWGAEMAFKGFIEQDLSAYENKPYPPYPITDKETLEACERLEQEIHHREAWDLGRQVLREVSKALTEKDWSGMAEVTPDFVVFPNDAEFDDIETTLQGIVSNPQIAAWKSRGLL